VGVKASWFGGFAMKVPNTLINHVARNSLLGAKSPAVNFKAVWGRSPQRLADSYTIFYKKIKHFYVCALIRLKFLQYFKTPS